MKVLTPQAPPAPRRQPARRRGIGDRISSSRSLLIGVALAALLAGGVVFGVTSTRISGAGPHEMNITFPSADGLVAGSDVLLAGTKIGYISDIQPTEQNSALVTVEIADDHWPLHTGLTAAIRPKSLLGEKYVDLHDGGAVAVYDASQVLHASAKADPVELDQFINSLDPATRTAIRVLLDDVGAGVAGRGNDFNAAIATGKANLEHLAVTGKTLNNRDPDLDKILVGIDGVLSKLTTNDQLTRMSQLITNGRNTLNDIESVQTAFSRQFTDASAALADLNIAFDGAIPSLQRTIDIAPQLIGNLRVETQQLAALGATVTTSANKFPQICNGQNGQMPTNYSSNVENHVLQGITPCSPLWALINGLSPGPTTSGGALEKNGITGQNNPIFRICLGLPTSPSGSCSDNFGSAQPAAYQGGTGSSDTAFFAEFLGS
jgi:phospholipid/cholesterol/gamma-HCH transport system substrate-binding protein